MTIYSIHLAHNADSPHHQHHPSASLLSVTTDRAASGVAILHAAGELDVATVPQLDAEARQVLHAGARGLVLDLREVGFLGIAGLTVLFDLVSLADARQATCRVVAATHPVFRALQVGDPAGRLHLAADVPAAVDECTSGHVLSQAPPDDGSATVTEARR